MEQIPKEWLGFLRQQFPEVGFHDRGMLLAGGCGDTNGPPQIGRTDWLERAHAFGQTLY